MVLAALALFCQMTVASFTETLEWGADIGCDDGYFKCVVTNIPPGVNNLYAVQVDHAGQYLARPEMEIFRTEPVSPSRRVACIHRDGFKSDAPMIFKVRGTFPGSNAEVETPAKFII